MKSAIIYNGPSLLDGKPIVVIATYSNRNTKTGKVVQTYILRSDINPLEASKTGEDFSICGDCTMRGEVTTDPARKQAKGRRCYVNLGQGVLIVFKSHPRCHLLLVSHLLVVLVVWSLGARGEAGPAGGQEGGRHAQGGEKWNRGG